jgi:hypothetical protein
MLTMLKNMPLLPKLLIGCLILAGVGRAIKGGHRSIAINDDPYRPVQAAYEQESGRSGGESSQRGQLLAQFQQQQAELQARAKQCMAEMQQATQQQAAAAMNGQMYYGQPACEAAMPQMIAQEAYYETEIYKLQGGDPHASVRDFVPNAPTGTESYSPSSNGASNSDRALDAADNWDRQAIRGNQLYTDEQGTTRELPSHDYYYRDRASGELVGSESSNPPDNSRDWEQITPQPQAQ